MEGSAAGWTDTHVHFFHRKELSYGWLATVGEPWTGILGDYTPVTLDGFLSGALPSGVTKIVHAEAAFGSDPAAESDWPQRLADLGKIPIAIVGHAALGDKDVETILDRQMENANFRGVRMLWGADGADTPPVLTGFKALVDRDLCFEDPFACENREGIAKFARASPRKIVVGHCCMLMKSDPESWASWRAAMQELGAFDNVYCKISGVHMTDHRWTVDCVRVLVDASIELFGPERCFFGSNWAVDPLYGGTLVDLMDNYRRIITSYSLDEQAAMLSCNASRFYRI